MDTTERAADAPTTVLPAAELPLVAFAIDGRVELRARVNDAEPELVLRAPHRFVYAYRPQRPGASDRDETAKGGPCRVHVFALGAVVMVGTDVVDDELRAFVERRSGRVMIAETVDRYRLVVDPRVRRPEVQWDRIVIPRLDDEVVDAVALILARSAGLERYERGAEPLLEQGLTLAREFAGHGRTPWATRPMIRRIAALAVSRLELARWFVHLDRPDPAWEDPVVDRLYELLGVHLELAERHEALMHRMSALERSLQMIVSVWESRRARFLEWAIVWLIVVEIAMALVRW